MPDASLVHMAGARYQALGRIVHLAEAWWVVDFGVLAFREESPPRDARKGCWVCGEILIGVDPFFYFEQRAMEADAPALIYDWAIEKVEMDTAPFIEVDGRYLMRDPARPGWKEIAKTDAWADGVEADYILHCSRDVPPRRRYHR